MTHQPYQQQQIFQQGYQSASHVHLQEQHQQQHQSNKILQGNRKRPRTESIKQQAEQLSLPVQKEEFVCTICSVTVESKKAYEAHCASHITCSAPNCSFEGAPKVVKAHYQSTHGIYSGKKGGGFKTITVAVPGCKVQRFRICVGNNPEDIQAWIAERKKQFPRKAPPPSQTTSKSPTNAKTKEANTSIGLSSLLEGYGSSSSEEEEEQVDNDITQKEQDKNTSSQTNTAEGEAVSTAATKSTDADEQHPNYRTRPCRFFARNGSCRNGDACRFKHEAPNPSDLGTISNHHNSNVTSNNNNTNVNAIKNNNRRKQRQPKTLLQNLLSKDIEREQTLTLQLLKYIVNHNFLDVDTLLQGDEEEHASRT